MTGIVGRIKCPWHHIYNACVKDYTENNHYTKFSHSSLSAVVLIKLYSRFSKLIIWRMAYINNIPRSEFNLHMTDQEVACAEPSACI